MEYAIINPAGYIVQTRPDEVPVAEHKGWRILPVVRDVPAEGERLTPPVEPVPEDAVEVRWTAVPIPLDDQKAALKARVTALRATKRNTSCAHNGHLWWADKGSCDDMATAKDLALEFEAVYGAGSFSTAWKAASGHVTVTLDDLRAAGLAVGIFVQGFFAREASLHAEIAAAEDAATLSAIDIEAGWPEGVV